MKVGIVVLNLLNLKRNNSIPPVHSYQVDINQPLIKHYSNDSYSFSAKKISEISFGNTKLPFYKRNGIPCPCCGRIMIPRSRFTKELTDSILSNWGEKAIKALAKFKQSMHEIEKQCFEKMQAESQKHPKKTLSQILKTFRKKSRKHLNERQFQVLDEMSQLVDKLSADSATKINEITLRAKMIITEDKPENPFKRKVFIKDIKQITDEIPEKQIGRLIYKKALELNTSENDLDAFIVKYALRSSTEIGQRLVSRSLGTIEHIHPKAQGGENTYENYLLECAGCNNSRGDMPLDEWIATKQPQMKRNAQKQINIIINLINKGIIRDFGFYPEDVAQTLMIESKGLIRLDLSKLRQKYQKAS